MFIRLGRISDALVEVDEYLKDIDNIVTSDMIEKNGGRENVLSDILQISCREYGHCM